MNTSRSRVKNSTRRVIEPVEIMYLSLMSRWMRTAPPDRHKGEKGGKRIRNTQIERLAFVLRNIGVGPRAEQTYSTIALHSRRSDGNSYVSKDPSWMHTPTPLTDGWYFEGCTSLAQKQAELHNLGKLGFKASSSTSSPDGEIFDYRFLDKTNRVAFMISCGNDASGKYTTSDIYQKSTHLTKNDTSYTLSGSFLDNEKNIY